MAIKSSFKQQCPSCEAMVPVRDPKLIGRKIDCPKCKYRFVVEEPVDDVDEVEEVPAKKGKSEAVTNKKPANGKAANGKTANGKAGKPAAKRRPDDDEDEEEAPRKKKKSGGSTMLIVGIGLAAVALIALAVGAVFLFTGDKTESKPSGGPSASGTPSGSGTNAGNPDQGNGGPKPDPNKGGPKPRQEDVTNLLPNDTQAVLNLPIDRLFQNPKVNQALLKTPGAFHEASFHQVWGIGPADVRRVLLAYNTEKKTLFSVMRTTSALKEEQIVAALKLKPEAPIGGLKYYLVTRPVDALSTFLLKGGQGREKVAMHFVDPFTVVCADVGPMNQFLQEKGQPKHLSTQPVEQPQSGQGGRPGMPGGGMQGGPPGGMQGGPPGGMQGGPPGGMQGGPPGGMQGGPMPPGGGTQPPSGPQQPGSTPQPPGGGSQPPSGGPQPPSGGPQQPGQPPSMPGGVPGGGPGGMFPGMPGMPGFPGGGTSNAAPVSASYMTVDPQLKGILDQIEKVDPKEGQSVLLSFAFLTTAIPVDLIKTLAQQGGTAVPVPDAMVKFALETSDLKAAGLAVTGFNESKVVVNGAVAAKTAKLAQSWEKQAITFAAGAVAGAGLDLVSKNQTSRFPGGPGMPGGFPGGPPGGMSGGPPGGPPQPGGSEQGPNYPQPGPGGFPGGTPPGGFPPGAFPPGMQPPGMEPPGGEKKEEKGKQGDYLFWTKDNVVALGLNFNIKSAQYTEAGKELEYVGIGLRGLMSASDRQSRIHELAAALQAYHEKEGHFPQGAVPRPPDGQHVLGWRPDQRLSWMTQILPYLGNGEFRSIRFNASKGWHDDPTNIKAGFAVIPQFTAPMEGSNPFSYFVKYPNVKVDGPDVWGATQFVGVAGVGLDAAEYQSGHPDWKKRGVFGYDRMTNKDEIKDGPEQTILLIQVPAEPKSPWIAGGGSTVRGVSDDLDCVRPFVCTKYKTADGKEEAGTFAIMADGKVRFIPASINPKTFQALCTIAAGDKIKNLDEVAPEVPAEQEPAQPELKAEQPAPPPQAQPPQQPAPPANVPQPPQAGKRD